MSFSQVSLSSITCDICPNLNVEYREQHDELCHVIKKHYKYEQWWFTCLKCERTFRSRKGIFEHLTAIHFPHLKGKKRKCNFCGNFFFVFNEYKEHVRLCRKFCHYMNLQSKRCLICEMFFPWPCDFQKHFSLRHPERMEEILSIEDEESEEEQLDDPGIVGDIPEPTKKIKKETRKDYGTWQCIFCGLSYKDYDGSIKQHISKFCKNYLDCVNPSIKECKICDTEIAPRPFFKNVQQHFFLKHKEYIFKANSKPTKGPYAEAIKSAEMAAAAAAIAPDPKPVRRGPPPLKPIGEKIINLPPLVPTLNDELTFKQETIQSIVKIEPSMPEDIEDEIV